jgi:hypothetical protein
MAPVSRLSTDNLRCSIVICRNGQRLTGPSENAVSATFYQESPAQPMSQDRSPASSLLRSQHVVR